MKGRLIACAPPQQEAILQVIERVLAGQPYVVFAYVYGSFVEGRPFHDVDVAVYLDTAAAKESGLIATALADRLEKALRCASLGPAAPPYISVDVRSLNQAPSAFLYHVFRGKLLFSRDETVRARLVERTISRYLDLKPLRRQALKEAMTTWS